MRKYRKSTSSVPRLPRTPTPPPSPSHALPPRPSKSRVGSARPRTKPPPRISSRDLQGHQRNKCLPLLKGKGANESSKQSDVTSRPDKCVPGLSCIVNNFQYFTVITRPPSPPAAAAVPAGLPAPLPPGTRKSPRGEGRGKVGGGRGMHA